MVDQLMSRQNLNSRFEIVGADIYQDFIERAALNYANYKKYLFNLDRIGLDFQGNLSQNFLTF
jgi:hypothetical protein